MDGNTENAVTELLSETITDNIANNPTLNNIFNPIDSNTNDDININLPIEPQIEIEIKKHPLAYEGDDEDMDHNERMNSEENLKDVKELLLEEARQMEINANKSKPNDSVLVYMNEYVIKDIIEKIQICNYKLDVLSKELQNIKNNLPSIDRQNLIIEKLEYIKTHLNSNPCKYKCSNKDDHIISELDFIKNNANLNIPIQQRYNLHPKGTSSSSTSPSSTESDVEYYNNFSRNPFHRARKPISIEPRIPYKKPYTHLYSESVLTDFNSLLCEENIEIDPVTENITVDITCQNK